MEMPPPVWKDTWTLEKKTAPEFEIRQGEQGEGELTLLCGDQALEWAVRDLAAHMHERMLRCALAVV